MTPSDLTYAVKRYAQRLGFDACRITAVGPAPHGSFFCHWLDAGRAGDMAYLARNVDRRQDPALLAAREDAALHSLIVLAVNYHQFDQRSHVLNDPSRGLIAAYAWGDDYHEIIRPQLHALDAFIRAQTGRTGLGKCFVDTGPVLERDWSQAAGIGFIGKNCCTIWPRQGSWLMLATILVPEILAYDPPPADLGPPSPSASAVLAGLPPHHNYGAWYLDADNQTDAGVAGPAATCGRCIRCLDSCPTGAFVGPYHLDAVRCIAYWTIETQAAIPVALRPRFGNRIFGCDICQEVCPYNAHLADRTPLFEGLRAQAGRVAPPLLEGFDPADPYWLDPVAFSVRFRRSPVKRAKRHGMLRNVCVALGNWADPRAVDALAQAMLDPYPVVRGHAAWALGQILSRHRHAPATAHLLQARSREPDATVQAEIALALAQA